MARRRRTAITSSSVPAPLRNHEDAVWEDPHQVLGLYVQAGIPAPEMVRGWTFDQAPPLLHFAAFRFAYCQAVGAVTNGLVDLHAAADMGISNHHLRRSDYFAMSA